MKYNKKRWLSIVLAGVIATGSAILPSAPAVHSAHADFRFNDTAQHWARYYIEYLSDKKIISGYKDGSYQPERQISREEAASLLANIVKAQGYSTAAPLPEQAPQVEAQESIDESGITEKSETVVEAPKKREFKDVPKDSWSYEAITLLANAGYVNGDGDGGFRPGDRITREEFVAIVYNVLKRNNVISDKTARKSFSDIKNSFAKEAIEKLGALGIISGDGDGRFRPQDHIIRSESAALLTHFFIGAHAEIRGMEETEARVKAEAEAKLKAEEEAKQRAEAEALAKAEEEARLKAEAEAKAAQEAKALEDAVAAEKRTAEEAAKQEAEAKRQAEERAELDAMARKTSYYKVLNMAPQKQINGYYCGPACVQQTVLYLNGKAEKQDYYASKLGTTKGVGTSMDEIAKFVKDLGNGYKYEKIGDKKDYMSKMKKNLEENQPVIIDINSRSTSAWAYKTAGHFLNVSGVDTKSGTEKIRVTDPATGKNTWYSVDTVYKVNSDHWRSALIR